LLTQFDRSGLSAAAFARRHQLTYTTFCGWRKQRARLKSSPAFVQVELTAATSPATLLIELGGQARLRISSADQIDLAAQLLRALNTKAAC
jgi:hypothetical protein